MPKHTNLPNKITGEYYRDKPQWFDYMYTISMGVIALALVMIFADHPFEAETVTNFIADLLGILITK